MVVYNTNPAFQDSRRVQQAVLELADVLQGAAAREELHLLGMVLQNLHPHQQPGQRLSQTGS